MTTADPLTTPKSRVTVIGDVGLDRARIAPLPRRGEGPVVEGEIVDGPDVDGRRAS